MLVETLNHRLLEFVQHQPWWPRAAPMQKQLCMSFGYPESYLDNNTLLDTYTGFLVFCGHHFACGILMLPVLFYGWGAAGSFGQSLFLIAGLLDVAMDIYDEIKLIGRTFFHNWVRAVWPVVCPMEIFVLVGLCHHPLAIMMVTPIITYFPELAPFHVLLPALVFAGAICGFTGSYKFVLDVRQPSGFHQYKAIVLIQLVTIYYTRGYLWFTQLWKCIWIFYEREHTAFLIGGVLAGLLMSFFNIILITDSTKAAVKWLPRSLPRVAVEQAELENDVVDLGSPSSSKGTARGGLVLATTLGLAPQAKRLRAQVQVLRAAGKFKKALDKEG